MAKSGVIVGSGSRKTRSVAAGRTGDAEVRLGSADGIKTKSSVIVFTGDGKGKTEAALGLVVRALGADFRVLLVQFIKSWEVSENKTLAKLYQVSGGRLTIFKGGKGFFRAGDLSAEGVSEAEHRCVAEETFAMVLAAVRSGEYDLVVADEINNAVHDGLLRQAQLVELIELRGDSTHLCLTGRDFPGELVGLVDYVTEMRKIKHPYDGGDLAVLGIDY